MIDYCDTFNNYFTVIFAMDMLEYLLANLACEKKHVQK
jgi:hypothetical protein